MSFGFSVGDFLTAGRLISDIIASLRTASVSEYRELLLELHGLQRALYEIEHLKCSPGQEAAINGIKVAALMCQYALDDFSAKLKKFERLGFTGGKTRSNLETMKIWTRKLQWGFCMKEEVEKLRTYIVVHVGSLNMRLITQGLVSTSFAAEQADRGRALLEGRFDDAYNSITQTQHNLGLHNSIARKNESTLKTLSNVITRDIVSQLKTLVDLASKIWDSNLQVIGFMIKLQTSITRPDSKFTWVQAPVKFEDALGRVIPVPSEYNWRKLEAIIKDQFRDGLGRQKVSAGEYELFNSFDSSKTVTLSEDHSLTPGMAITMAIVIGQYESGPLSQCPRPDCRSTRVTPNEAGGMSCLICTAWFDLARHSLPRPLRPPVFDYQETDGPTAGVRGTKRKRDVTDTGEQADTQQLHLKLRMERKRFKNVRLHFTKLPEAPRPRNGRSLSPIPGRLVPPSDWVQTEEPNSRSYDLDNRCKRTKYMSTRKEAQTTLPLNSHDYEWIIDTEDCLDDTCCSPWSPAGEDRLDGASGSEASFDCYD